ncbi:MAG: NYN domain-containing protein [Spirochaetia bacterium]
MQKIENVAILWDIENVTPASTDTLFIEGLLEYAESMGRIITNYAYADWAKPNFSRLGKPLAARHFRLAHVPRERKGKNSADMQLVSDALELLRFYEHIDRYILVTGDSDFRPLLLSLRKSGKRVHIVCDLKTAAQDLLALADSFVDYRDLLPADDDDEDDDEGLMETSQEYWFERLAEACQLLKKENRSASFSPVKVKMRMLNPGFQEEKLGYKRFSDFVRSAVRAGYVSIERDDEDAQPNIHAIKTEEKNLPNGLQAALQILVEGLNDLDRGAEPKFHTYTQIGIYLRQRGINLKSLGFAQLKKFMQSAQTRGLVETKIEEMKHYAKIAE